MGDGSNTSETKHNFVFGERPQNKAQVLRVIADPDSDQVVEEQKEISALVGSNDSVTIQIFNCPVDHIGTTIYVKAWTRPSNPKPPIIFVHGLRENVGVYRDATKAFVAAGYDVFGFDLRGHGRSGTMLGHIPHFESLINDLLQVVAWVRYQSGRRTPIIVSQGIGALIAVHFGRRYPEMVRAGVLVAPCFWGPTSRMQRFLIKFLAEMMPTFRLSVSMTPKFLGAYHHAARNRLSGPILRWGFYGITANFVNEILNAVSDMDSQFREYTAPSLFIYPCKDLLFDYSPLHQMIETHPQTAHFDIKAMPEAGHHVLSGRTEDLNGALEHILPWLELHAKDEQEQIAHKS